MAQAVLHILILQTVVFFGQGQKRFRKQYKRSYVHRHFARLRFEHKPGKTEYIADIVLLFIGEIILFADILTGIILFFIIGSEFFITYKVSLRKGKKEA